VEHGGAGSGFAGRGRDEDGWAGLAAARRGESGKRSLEGFFSSFFSAGSAGTRPLRHPSAFFCRSGAGSKTPPRPPTGAAVVPEYTSRTM
jgi:hypothetical protein